MKSIHVALMCVLLITACKSDKKEHHTTTKEVKWTTAEKIANAHGFQNWKNVSEIKFTFKVDRDTIKSTGRAWVWHPKTDKVKMTAGETTTEYVRNQMDSTQLWADRAFINDKFWLLIPFQLVWDTSTTISEPITAKAPISQKTMQKITLTYSSEGGYTPGDAYDIFYDDEYLIREWIFRKGNAKTPSLITTFENYRDYEGIKIATDHKQDSSDWNLNCTDVKVILE